MLLTYNKLVTTTNGVQDMPVLSNAKVKWAKIQEPERSEKYGDSWSVEVELSNAQVQQLTADGLAAKIADQKDQNKVATGTSIIRLKRKTKGTKRTGGTFDKQQPKCVDSVKQPFTSLIGNGSVCNVAYNIVESTFGISADFAGIQVLELVSFGGGGKDASDEFESVDGGATPIVANDIGEDEVPF